MITGSKGIVLLILGIVAVVAMTGLVLTYKNMDSTGNFPFGSRMISGPSAPVKSSSLTQRRSPTPSQGVIRIPSRTRTAISIPISEAKCPAGTVEVDYGEKLVYESQGYTCTDYIPSVDGYCCSPPISKPTILDWRTRALGPDSFQGR